MNGIGNRWTAAQELADRIRILEAFEARLKRGKTIGTHMGRKKKGAAQ